MNGKCSTQIRMKTKLAVQYPRNCLRDYFFSCQNYEKFQKGFVCLILAVIISLASTPARWSALVPHHQDISYKECLGTEELYSGTQNRIWCYTVYTLCFYTDVCCALTACHRWDRHGSKDSHGLLSHLWTPRLRSSSVGPVGFDSRCCHSHLTAGLDLSTPSYTASRIYKSVLFCPCTLGTQRSDCWDPSSLRGNCNQDTGKKS